MNTCNNLPSSEAKRIREKYMSSDENPGTVSYGIAGDRESPRGTGFTLSLCIAPLKDPLFYYSKLHNAGVGLCCNLSDPADQGIGN